MGVQPLGCRVPAVLLDDPALDDGIITPSKVGAALVDVHEDQSDFLVREAHAGEERVDDRSDSVDVVAYADGG